MQRVMLKDTYPVFTAEIAKSESSCQDVDQVIEALKRRIEADASIRFIGLFDHMQHTRAIGGEIAPEIRDAKEIVFCFGKQLPNPVMLAVRPRAIGVADLGERFVVSFMEAPVPAANDAMTSWVEGLRDKA